MEDSSLLRCDKALKEYLEAEQCVYIRLIMSVEGEVTELSKMFGEYRFNHNHLKSGATGSTITNVSYSMQIPRICPLILEDRINFLLVEPNPVDNVG
jgi:hypothetical protein